MKTGISIFRKEQYHYSLIPFRIIINGKEQAKLMPGESIQIPQVPGKFSLQIRMSFYRSHPVEFDLKSGEQANFMAGLKQNRKTSVGRYFETMKIHNILIEKVDKEAMNTAAIEANKATAEEISKSFAKQLMLLDVVAGLVFLTLSLFYKASGFANSDARLFLFISGLVGITSAMVYFNLKNKTGTYAKSIKMLHIRAYSNILWLVFLILLSFPDIILLIVLFLMAVMYYYNYFVLINRNKLHQQIS